MLYWNTVLYEHACASHGAARNRSMQLSLLVTVIVVNMFRIYSSMDSMWSKKPLKIPVLTEVAVEEHFLRNHMMNDHLTTSSASSARASRHASRRRGITWSRDVHTPIYGHMRPGLAHWLTHSCTLECTHARAHEHVLGILSAINALDVNGFQIGNLSCSQDTREI